MSTLEKANIEKRRKMSAALVKVDISLGFVIYALNIHLGFVRIIMIFPLGFIKNCYICR